MKRKLGLFLSLCILVTSLIPQGQVYAVSQNETEVSQLMEETEELVEMESEMDSEIHSSFVELTRSDIPDQTLWNYFSVWKGSDGILTADDLLLIEEITINTSGGIITNLKGIEYAKNLKICSFKYHWVTDEGVSPLLKCTKLESIDLTGNQLMKMPDFSGLINLNTLKISGNYILKEDITEDKYPVGMETTGLWKQNPRSKLYLVENMIYKDATESGTYGVAIEISGFPNYANDVRVKITDITEGGSEVLYDEIEEGFRYYYPADTEFYYGGRTCKIDITEMKAISGNRTWEISCKVGTKEIKETFTVTVDENGEGGFQEVPEAILPRELSDYMIGKLYNYDKNKDGMISFLELAEITYFSLGYSEETKLELETYDFLPYMKELQNLSLTDERGFTQKHIESLVSLEELKYLSLSNVGLISDISVIKDIYKLNVFNFYGASNVSGLPALKEKEVPVSVYCSEGTFPDEDIFDFILSKKDGSIPVGTGKKIVLDSPMMKSMAEIEVSVSHGGMVDYREENPFFIYGMQPGETSVTYTLGEISHTVNLEVTGEPWDFNPVLEQSAISENLMHFEGTEGVENARSGWTMVDGEENIWNISTRTPEKILDRNQYTKYAARLVYSRNPIFSAETNTSFSGDSFYLDQEGSLWAYNREYWEGRRRFENRFEVMRDVEDWQEGGYNDENHWIPDYILIQKKDGSLWYYNYSYKYYYDKEEEYGKYYFNAENLEKLEDSGVTGVYPNSYLKEGTLYHVGEEGEVTEIAGNIVKVWDNTSIVLAQDAEGNYYTTKGRIELTGTVKKFLMSNCWDYDYVKEMEEDPGFYEPTERDMIASYLLMEDGNLYRSIYSADYMENDFVLSDTGVTDLEKDYYWKGDICYWFTGEKYSDYIGNGLGRGLYPVWEIDEETGQGSITLYVNGIPYLTKVYDWIVSGRYVYAVRLDNTLWEFDEENTPAKIDFADINTSLKPVETQFKEIQILDLQKRDNGILVKWSQVDGADSYKLNITSDTNPEQWIMLESSVTEYLVIPLEQEQCYYMIQAVDEQGEILAQSWRFYTTLGDNYNEDLYGLQIHFVDDKGKQIPEENGIYTLPYTSSMKGKKLYLNLNIKGVENPGFTVNSGSPAVAEIKLWEKCAEVTIQGSGTTKITITDTATGFVKSIYLNLKDANANKKIKVKAALKKKLNLFYKDTSATYELTSTGGNITKVEFIPTTGTEAYFRTEFISGTGELNFYPILNVGGKSVFDLEKRELAKALKGQLKVTVGDKILTQKIKLKLDNKRPAVSLTEVSRKVYKFDTGVDGQKVYGGTIIHFQPVDKVTGEILNNVAVTLTNYKKVKNGVDIMNFSPGYDIDGSQEEYRLVKNSDGKYTIHFTGERSAVAVIKIQEDNWAKPVLVNYRVNVSNAKLKGKLSSHKVTLNKQYTGDEKELKLTTNIPYSRYTLGEWEITKLPKAVEDGSGITIQKTADGLKILMSEQKRENLAEGNYMVKIPVTFYFPEGTSYTPKPLYVKVNIINRQLTAKDIRWKASGAINLLCREKSEITALPVFSGLNASLYNAKFSAADIEAGMDKKYLLYVEDGVLKIRLKSGQAISAKEKSIIKPVLTVRTESGVRHTFLEVPGINIRLEQGGVSVVCLRKSLIMYKSREVTLSHLIPFELRGPEGVIIEKIESATEGFEVKLLGDGKLQLEMTDPDKKPKSYKVKMNVYFKDQAVDKKQESFQIKVVLKK